MLFKRPEEGGGEDIFCHFDADSPVKTYRLSRWFSDEWDAMDYGREIDWSRPFFSQFVELLRAVPLKALTVVRGDGNWLFARLFEDGGRVGEVV